MTKTQRNPGIADALAKVPDERRADIEAVLRDEVPIGKRVSLDEARGEGRTLHEEIGGGGVSEEMIVADIDAKRSKPASATGLQEGRTQALDDDREAGDEDVAPDDDPIATAMLSVPPDYAAQFRTAATAARYIAHVLKDMAATWERTAEEGADPDELRDLAWFARVQAAFSGSPEVPPTAAQVALSIARALRLERRSDATVTDWVLHCIRSDFPSVALRVNEGTRAMLGTFSTHSPSDKELAAVAAALVGQRVTTGAVKTARAARRRQR